LLEVPIESTRSRRSTKTATAFEPLRIYLHYDESVLNLPSEKQLFVNSSLLPEAAGYWENVLRVARTEAPIRLRRKCVSSYYYYRNEKKRVACDRGCREATNCGETIIPPEHLLECSYCLSSDDCYSSGEEGEGVRDADFILYVTAIATKRCDSVDTLAYAAHCQQEARLDRPVAGYVNLCPSALSTHRHDREILFSTVKHEILHALGFSVGLYAFFRDENGKPRTKRNRYGKPISFNKEFGYYDWDRNTITTVLREDWWTGEGRVSRLLRPKNEMSSTSLRLRSAGGRHSTHPLGENEAMTGTHTQNPVYSRMTLALLEDSGWYKPNYEEAEELHWGRKLGCDFVKKSCGEWINSKIENGELPSPFCNEVKHDGQKSLAYYFRCTSQRDSLAICNLVPYKKELPVQFRNFAKIEGVSAVGAKHYGGTVELADYCPYSQEFQWKLPNSTLRQDSRCELEGNNRDGEDILEVYGTLSRCFDFKQPFRERKCGRVRSLLHYMAGCYEHSCQNGTLHIAVHDSDFYPCYSTGQHIHIKRITDGWLREGVIVCPPCDEFCSQCKNHDVVPLYIGRLIRNCAQNRLTVLSFQGSDILPCVKELSSGWSHCCHDISRYDVAVLIGNCGRRLSTEQCGGT
uniref:Leishmanolysin-like peptidase n=1 Tax=Heligmosomoides polygyrus TaxID=6339 RepID=A0A8L8KUM5_HELPZ